MKEYIVEFDCAITQRVQIKVESESVEGIEQLAADKISEEWRTIQSDFKDASLNIKLVGVKSKLETGE